MSSTYDVDKQGIHLYDPKVFLLLVRINHRHLLLPSSSPEGKFFHLKKQTAVVGSSFRRPVRYEKNASYVTLFSTLLSKKLLLLLLRIQLVLFGEDSFSRVLAVV